MAARDLKGDKHTSLASSSTTTGQTIVDKHGVVYADQADILLCGVSRLELLKMVQNLTGRVEQLEQGRNLTDEVGKLGEAMTGAVEKLGEKLTQGLGEAMTGALEKLGDRNEKLGESLTNAIQRLDNIHLLTTARNQTLRVDLEDFDNNTVYAEYRFFAIDGPDFFYRLHVDGDSLAYHNNRPFTTHDSDHDSSSSGNCAVDWRGAWWYIDCHHSNLNGPYLTSAQQTLGKSISWWHWKKAFIALKHVEMKIRPAM
nr:hypothetical protein BaRGS_013609 [Batillaria attramentaria]